MNSNPNLSILMEKLFDREDVVDQIMKTDDMTELYELCQKVHGGYTFEEFIDFFESLVCICLDEAKDLKEFMENNADKIDKLSEKDLKNISGEVVIDLSGSKCWVNNIAITWLGYEFLDASRSNKIWNEVKSKAIEKGVSLTFDGLLQALKVAAQVGVALAFG